jgi:hypothetical protein
VAQLFGSLLRHLVEKDTAMSNVNFPKLFIVPHIQQNMPWNDLFLLVVTSCFPANSNTFTLIYQKQERKLMLKLKQLRIEKYQKQRNTPPNFAIKHILKSPDEIAILISFQKSMKVKPT